MTYPIKPKRRARWYVCRAPKLSEAIARMSKRTPEGRMFWDQKQMLVGPLLVVDDYVFVNCGGYRRTDREWRFMWLGWEIGVAVQWFKWGNP